MVDVCDAPRAAAPGGMLDPATAHWSVLLPRTKLKADTRHVFDKELDSAGKLSMCTHVRLSIYPDGGVSRMRLWGKPAL
jgi:allantoicase